MISEPNGFYYHSESSPLSIHKETNGKLSGKDLSQINFDYRLDGNIPQKTNTS
jgi:hypothetical protein